MRAYCRTLSLYTQLFHAKLEHCADSGSIQIPVNSRNILRLPPVATRPALFFLNQCEFELWPITIFFTSESVSEGHPDKVADQVSDAVLDAMLAQDAESRVACETLIKTGLIVVAGEVRSNAQVDIDKLVREVAADIGYNSPDVGFDPESLHRG